MSTNYDKKVKYAWYENIWLRAIVFAFVLAYSNLNPVVNKTVQTGAYFQHLVAEYIALVGILLFVQFTVYYLIFGNIWRRMFTKTIIENSWKREVVLLFEFGFVYFCYSAVNGILFALFT